MPRAAAHYIRVGRFCGHSSGPDGRYDQCMVSVDMTCSEVVALLGAPTWSARGHSCRLDHEFNGSWPGMAGTELASRQGSERTVVWGEDGGVLDDVRFLYAPGVSHPIGAQRLCDSRGFSASKTSRVSRRRQRDR